MFLAEADDFTVQNSTSLGIKTEDGVTYHSFGPGTDNRGIGFKIDGGMSQTGKYMVVKMRTNIKQASGWQDWFDFDVSRIKFQETKLDSGKWVTFVVDLEKARPTQFPTSEDGTHGANTLKFDPEFTTKPIPADSIVDVAYVAFCSNIQGVINVMDQDKVVYQEAQDGNGNCTEKTRLDLCKVAGNVHDKYVDNGDGTHSIYCSICGSKGAKENHNSVYSANNDGTHTVSCSICGIVGKTEAHTYDNTVTCACGDKKYEGVMFLAEADDFTVQNSTSLGIKTEDGVTYHSFGPANANGMDNWGIGFKINGGMSQTGKYMVVKMRTNIKQASSQWQDWFWFSSGRIKFQETKLDSGAWVTFVVDLTKARPTQFPENETGEYGANTLRFDPHFPNRPIDANSFVDVAYVAFCSDITGILNVIDQDKVVYQEKQDGNGNCTEKTVKQLEEMKVQ
jgi:hypothetical protein